MSFERLAMSSVLALAVACMPYQKPGGDSQAADSAESDADADTDSDTDTDNPPQLTSAHTGWRSACCLDCHDSTGHRAGLEPYQCIGCHDKNGSPAGHGGSTPCLDCHGTGGGDAPLVHQCTNGSFPDPVSCQTCHGT
jgi:hypothetical protein